MARTQPLPGYTRPRQFGVWPRSTIPLPNRHRMSGAQCDRFMTSLQNLIARHMFDTEGVSLAGIGRFWIAPNRPTTYDGDVIGVAGTYRDPSNGIEYPQRRAFVMRYLLAESLRKEIRV